MIDHKYLLDMITDSFISHRQNGRKTMRLERIKLMLNGYDETRMKERWKEKYEILKEIKKYKESKLK